VGEMFNGKRLSRRGFLGGFAGAAGAAILAACGGETATVAPTAAPVATRAATVAATTGSAATTAPAATTGAAAATTAPTTAAAVATTAPAVATTAPAATTGATTSVAVPATTGAAINPTAAASATLGGQSQFVTAFANTAGAGSPVDSVMIRQRTELVFYHSQTGPNEIALKQITDAFTAANPNIVINLQGLTSYDNVSAKVRADLQGGKPPDLAVGYENDVANYMTGEAVLDLAPYINSKTYGWTREDLNDIFPGFLDRNLYRDFKNQILSAPFAASVLMMWVNNDMLKSMNMTAPKTWDDFKRIADMSVKAGKKGLPINTDASILDGMVFSFGGEVISADNKRGQFDTPAAMGALQVLDDMGKAGTLYQVRSTADSQAAFTNGEVPFYLGSSTGRGYIQDTIFKDKANPGAGDKFDWAGTSIPQGPSNQNSPKTALYGGNVIVFKTTPEKQLASWQFVKYFASRDVTAKWGQVTGYLPVRKSAAESVEYKAFLAMKPVNGAPLAVAPSGKGEPQPAGWSKSRTDIAEVMAKLFNKQTSAMMAAQELQMKINRNLSE